MMEDEELETNLTEACEHCGEEIAAELDACPACGFLRVQVPCVNHAERNAEGQCVICGSTLCDGCNRGGSSHYVCASHQEIPVVNGWAQVYTTPDDIEAQLISENLQAQGLDSRVLSQKDHFSLPVGLGDLSQVRVLVPADAYGEAVDLIAQHMNAGEVRFGDGEESTEA
jgi:hypothetical protein